MVRDIYSQRPAWAEINLDSVARNVEELRKLFQPEVRIMAVVKADGYGHGAAAVAETALQAGASSLAVAFVEEGTALRRAGIDAPILVFGYTDPLQFSLLSANNLTPTIFDFATAMQFSRLALEQGFSLPLHIKIDTGMGRLGLLPSEAVETIYRITRLPGLQVEGIYTHFAAADEDDQSYSREQLMLFNRILDRCREKGIVFSLVHAANSAAAMQNAHTRFNLVRIGLSLYGHYPNGRIINSVTELKPALSFKSRVAMVKTVPPGSAISYGCTYITSQESQVATISVGYADGYSRLLSNRGEVLVRGRRAPVIGRICMDHLMVDTTMIPGVQQGDEVVLYGRQGSEEIRVEEMAEKSSTISYELLCAVGRRVPRFYFKEGKLCQVYDQDAAFLV